MKVKFRVWCPREKRWVGVTAVAYNGNILRFDDSRAEGGKGRWIDPEAKLSFWTGLLDKNGRELYEGDIVKDKVLDYKTKQPEKSERIFEMYWDVITASFWQRLVDDPSKVFRAGYNFAAEKHCEIIGNRWENPELLEKRE